MQNLSRLLAVLVIALAMQSCQKDPVMVDPMTRVFNIKMSPNALEYVNIPVGKYFVYKVPGYTALDSVVVTNNELAMVNFPRDNSNNFPEHNVQRLRLTMTQYIQTSGGMITTEWLKGVAMPEIFNPYDSTTTADVRLRFSGTQQVIFYGAQNISGSLTMVVEGVTYTGVSKAESDNGLPISNAGYEKNTFYWAKGVGIIKRVVVNWNGATTEMNLLRHN